MAGDSAPVSHGETPPLAKTPAWCVYILGCRGDALYVGITPNLAKRFAAHQQGRASFFTRLNPPEEILGQVWLATRHDAAVLERRVKRLCAADKVRWLSTVTAADGFCRRDGQAA